VVELLASLSQQQSIEEQKDMNRARIREREKPPGRHVDLTHASASTAQHVVAHASMNC
jgi:hypothetical protein